MRVTTAFNRILNLPGASVQSVSFTDTGIVVGLRRLRRLMSCPCGYQTRARYDTSRRRWRHLDFGATKIWLEADIHRIACPHCAKVRTEQVPWARPGARHSQDFEDLTAWLAQRMDKTAISRLMRCSWEAVDHIVRNVVADHIDDTRLDNLVRIGVDEISYKRGHQYLTIVADHDTGKVVWIDKERTQASFTKFFDALGRRSADLQAISLDASGIFMPVARAQAPQARLCLDPFHVIRWVTETMDSVYRAEAPTLPSTSSNKSRQWRRTRFALRSAAERLDQRHTKIIRGLRRLRYRLWRAWELKEQFRDLYRTVDPAEARAYFKAWCTAALRSRIPAFRNLVTRLRKHTDAIIAAVELGVSNSRLEGINSKIRVIQRRGRGFRDVDSLTSMIYLCLGGITVTLPTES